jgi:hypothetical protein
MRHLTIRGRRLVFSDSGLVAKKDAPLPFGIRLDLKAHRVFIRRTQDKAEQICATFRAADQNARAIIISPAYEAHDILPGPVEGKDAEMRLWTVVTDLDRLRSREVIQREHYLSDPGQGMILACAFVDNGVQRNARKIAARRNVDTYKISWHLPAGGIVGCAIVGTMWHGNPRDGRQLIATNLGVGNEWLSWKRPEIIQNFESPGQAVSRSTSHIKVWELVPFWPAISN